MSDGPSHTPAPRALFLSYAREDAATAKRLCDALRGFGMEVWFDQNELRGGDSWDAKIRQQIRSCALFMPIISGTTQHRAEGYFRREWKTAVERMADMAGGVAFLVPVVIDDTPESEALVPDEFRKVHWTFLRDGLPTPEFVAQVKQLLDNPRVRRPAAFAPSARGPDAASHRRGVWPWVVAGVAVCAAAAAFLVRSPAKAPAAGSAVPAPAPPAVPAPAPHPVVSEKSLAVLPFTNMSEEKDTSYFADGIHEDLLTNLAMVKDLRVVSRTSVLRYKDTTKSIPEIASELGVAYILEGSVQRSGNRVRVTGQLIKAASDEHVWAKSYDRDLNDTFAIQTDLATEIATALAAQITPQEHALLAAWPTDNPTAYDLYLKARQLANDKGPGPQALQQELAFYRSAVALDPKFAAAWGELADIQGLRVFNSIDASPEARQEAEEAMAKALALAPDSPDVIGAYGTYLYYLKRDYNGAIAQYLKLKEIRPHSADICNSLGYITRRQGNWAESCEWGRKSIELDPKLVNSFGQLAQTLGACKRFAEAAEIYERGVALLGTDKDSALILRGIAALARWNQSRDPSDVRRFVDGLSPEERETPAGRLVRMSVAVAMADFKEAIRLYLLQPDYNPLSDMPWENRSGAALSALALGDRALAVSIVGDAPERIREKLRQQPRADRLLAYLGLFELVLGQKEQARADLDRSIEMVPLSEDQLQTPAHLRMRVYWEAYYGDREKAIDGVRKLMRLGNGFCLTDLDADPGLWPLHGMARFEAMKKDLELDAPIDGPGTF